MRAVNHTPEPPEDGPAWGFAQRMTLATVTLLGTAVAVVVLALNGYAPLVAVVGGLWWGIVPGLLMFAVPMVVAPARMIRWRGGVIARGGYQTTLALRLSKLLAIAGPRPWDSDVARHRVRTLGLLYIVVGLGVGFVVLQLRG